jgi:PhnB protein
MLETGGNKTGDYADANAQYSFYLTDKSSNMSEQVNPIPYENQNIIPYIMVEDVARLITFLESAFGAQLTYKLNRNDGSIMHAEVKIGSNRIMMGEPTEQFGAMPVSIYMYVANCDAVYETALSAGATSLMEVKTMVHAGERYGCVKDFAGNIWWIASHVEDMTLEESERRVKEMADDPHSP